MLAGAFRRCQLLFATRLQMQKLTLAVANQGISGNQLVGLNLGAAQPIISGLARFKRDVLSQVGVGYIISLIGINDIGQSPNTMDPQVFMKSIIEGYRQTIELAHEHKLKIYAATLLPIGGSVYSSPAHQHLRQLVNTWIRQSREFDAVIDFDAVVRDTQNPEIMKTAYDSGDHLHPSDGGYQAMAGSINLALFK